MPQKIYFANSNPIAFQKKLTKTKILEQAKSAVEKKQQNVLIVAYRGESIHNYKNLMFTIGRTKISNWEKKYKTSSTSLCVCVCVCVLINIQ